MVLADSISARPALNLSDIFVTAPNATCIRSPLSPQSTNALAFTISTLEFLSSIRCSGSPWSGSSPLSSSVKLQVIADEHSRKVFPRQKPCRSFQRSFQLSFLDSELKRFLIHNGARGIADFDRRQRSREA